jgi:hypothetical protein
MPKKSIEKGKPRNVAEKYEVKKRLAKKYPQMYDKAGNPNWAQKLKKKVGRKLKAIKTKRTKQVEAAVKKAG